MGAITVDDKDRLQIGELAALADTSAKTIRFYEDEGLLPPARRAANDYRVYASDDVERLRFIRSARDLGFSLNDLHEILALRERGEAPCRYVVHLIDHKRSEIDARIRQLHELQAELDYLLGMADQLPDDEIEMKRCICHLITDSATSSKSK
ncbi:MAG: heavy metal-responsive transcriptional regulator [Chloroflexi bacterium]|nr:heavy metal-responsive transcriptional regulator [Chloroflexota bacterium]